MINPCPPKAINRKIGDGPKKNIKKKRLHLIGAKQLEMTMSEGSPVWMLVARKVKGRVVGDVHAFSKIL